MLLKFFLLSFVLFSLIPYTIVFSDSEIKDKLNEEFESIHSTESTTSGGIASLIKTASPSDSEIKEILIKEGIKFLEQDKHNEAISYFDRVLSFDPNMRQSHILIEFSHLIQIIFLH